MTPPTPEVQAPSPDHPANPWTKNMSKFGKFWLSAKGRNAMGFIATGVACGVFGGYIALHTVFLNKYKDVVQLYKNGFMTPLTGEVFDRANAVVREMRLSEKDKNYLRFFTVSGTDMFFAGSLKLKSGAIIGIPRNYSYKDVKDIERNDIIVGHNPVSWGSEDGMLLQDSLILSENAQKFAIARNIQMANTHHVYAKGILGSTFVLMYTFISRSANNILYGLYKPRSFRIVMYSGVGMFCFGLWAVFTDVLTKYYENLSDKLAGNVNLSYARGGVEFYCKTLQRNMAIRALMGEPGEKLFTFYGNDVEFLRERHVPYTRRKTNLEKIAEKMSQTEDTTE